MTLHEFLLELFRKHDQAYAYIEDSGDAESVQLDSWFNLKAIAEEFAAEVLRRHTEGAA